MLSMNFKMNDEIKIQLFMHLESYNSALPLTHHGLAFKSNRFLFYTISLKMELFQLLLFNYTEYRRIFTMALQCRIAYSLDCRIVAEKSITFRLLVPP